MGHLYAHLDTVRGALSKATADTGDDAEIERLIEVSSRLIEAECDLHAPGDAGSTYGWYPHVGVWDEQAREGFTSHWFDVPLTTCTSLAIDGAGDATFSTTLALNTDYVLEPRAGVPKRRARFIPGGSFVGVDPVLGVGSYATRGVLRITGARGHHDETEDTGANVDAAGIDASATTLPVTTVAGLHVGQHLLAESEQLRITAVGVSDVTVERGQNGTTAAAHVSGVDLLAYRYPRGIEQATVMQATRLYQRRSSAYATVVGTPDIGTTMEVFGGLDNDVKRLIAEYRSGLGFA